MHAYYPFLNTTSAAALLLVSGCFDVGVRHSDRDDTSSSSASSMSTTTSSHLPTSDSSADSSSSDESSQSTPDSTSDTSTTMTSTSSSTGSDESDTNPENETAKVDALSCSAADVQAALDLAKNGDTVLIPGGEPCDWRDERVYTKKGVWLKGAGKGVTVIHRSVKVKAAQVMIEFDCEDQQQVRVSHMTFLGNDDNLDENDKRDDEDNGLLLSNSCIDFRIHDVEFSKFSIAGLTISGKDSRGVVDHCDFLNNFKCQVDEYKCNGYGVAVYGDGTHPSSTNLGTKHAVFVEDSTFYANRHAITSDKGSRFVFRYNDVLTIDKTNDWGMVDAEGKESDSSLVGSATWEIYHNMIRSQLSEEAGKADGIYLRGGNGVVFNNAIDAGIDYTVKFVLEDDCDDPALDYPVPGQTVDAWIWGHEDQYIRVDNDCLKYFHSGVDYHAGIKPGYEPYTHPHPLTLP